jgi:acyl-coenzyme A thioesterase PaaI-like protein
MEVTKIPFVKFLEIKSEKENLSLEYRENIFNHVQTIHASAQFALAETQSGVFLQELFPHLEGKVIPLLRDATIKYKKPAQKKIYAFASVSDANLKKFQELFEKKERGSIEVDVIIKDIDNVVTAVASFVWFITKI